jgi:hypothetical protein
MADTKSDFKFPDDEEYAGMVFEEGGELTVNLADVEEMKFENVPKGTYNAEVDEATFGMSQSSGQHMITFRMRRTDGEYAGRKLPFYASFSAKALPGTKANLARISPELASTPFKPRELCDNGYFIGKPVKVRIDLQEYQGEKRSQIRGLQAASGGEGDGFLSS